MYLKKKKNIYSWNFSVIFFLKLELVGHVVAHNKLIWEVVYWKATSGTYFYSNYGTDMCTFWLDILKKKLMIILMPQQLLSIMKVIFSSKYTLTKKCMFLQEIRNTFFGGNLLTGNFDYMSFSWINTFFMMWFKGKYKRVHEKTLISEELKLKLQFL